MHKTQPNVRPASYAEWKQNESMIGSLSPSVDLLKISMPGKRTQHLSLSKILGKKNFTLPQSNLGAHLLHEKSKVTSVGNRQNMVASRRYSPSESSRIYVAGALHKLVESGEIPESLSPVARKFYASEFSISSYSPAFSEPSLREALRNTRRFGVVRPASASLARSHDVSGSCMTLSQLDSTLVPHQIADADASTLGPSKTRAYISSHFPDRATFAAREAGQLLSSHQSKSLQTSANLLSAYDVLSLSFFARVLPAECLRILSQGSQLLDCEAGKVLTLQGRRCDAAYVLVDGQLIVYEMRPGTQSAAPERAEVARHGETGNCVAETAVLTGAAAPHTVQCATPCRLVRVPIGALQAVIRRAPHAANLLAVRR